MSEQADTTEVEAELDWHRPHPLTLVLEITGAIRTIAIGLVLVVGGLPGAASLAEIAVVVIPLGAAIARWYTTRYALGTEAVHRHYGLIWRTRQVLPRSNIQNVSTKAGLIARLGSVVEMQISDASADGDIAIRFVTQAEANRIATALRSTMATTNAEPGLSDAGPGLDAPPPTAEGSVNASEAGPDGVAPAPGGPAVERAPLIAPTLRQLGRASFISNGGVVGLITILFVTLVMIVVFVFDVRPTDLQAADDLEDLTSVSDVVPFAVIGAAIVIVVSSLAGPLLPLGGYRLYADPDRLRIQAGLITEAQIAARRERVQQLRVERQLIHRRIGIERVAFETADLEITGTIGTGYLAPVAPAGLWRSLAEEVFGSIQLDERDLTPVSRLTIRRVRVRFAILSLPLLLLAAVQWWLPIVPIAAMFALGWWYGKRRYRELGVAVGSDQLLVRTGVFDGRLALVMLDKVQVLRLHASPFQRRLGLTTLSLSTAGKGGGGRVRLPDLPTDEAEQLLERLSSRAAITPIAETL